MKTIITSIPDYKTFYKGEKTLEIGYPWLTFGAIMALEKILRDSKGSFRILELGSGGSTVFFASRCKYLLSLEHSILWAKKVREYFINSTNLLCYRASRLVRIIKDQHDESFDLILVDNGSGAKTYVHRQQLLNVVSPKLKKGGWLVIDNYDRLKFDYTGYEVFTFDMFKYSGKGTKLCKKL